MKRMHFPLQADADAGTPLDLSRSNPDLQHLDVGDQAQLASYVDAIIKKAGAQFAYGGYLEQRGIYERSGHFGTQDLRDIHLGLDLWMPAGTQVHAVAAGVVHSLQDNAGFGNYGPTIILEHRNADTPFNYSLYGHLSTASLSMVEVGREITAGACVGNLGSHEVNGDYPPHLHLQLMLDLEGHMGDYPGVCTKDDLPAMKKNTIDPGVLLGLYAASYD